MRGVDLPRAIGTALLCCVLLAPAAFADQTAPELDALFTALGKAADREAAAGIEQQIWAHWTAGPSPQANALLDDARAAAETGDAALALALFERLVNEFPDYAEGWNQRAILHYMQGDVQAALDDIARVLTLEPRHFGAYAGRGQCYLRLERLRDSLLAFEASLHINPWSTNVAQQAARLREYLAEKLTPI